MIKKNETEAKTRTIHQKEFGQLWCFSMLGLVPNRLSVENLQHELLFSDFLPRTKTMLHQGN